MNLINMRKLLLLTVVALLFTRLAAQTADTTVNQNLEVPTVILLDSDFDETSTSVNDASTLLHSSRDVFNSIAAYNFGSLRYRVRGNDSKYADVMINGILMNDPETGRPVYSNWGGLNDAMRNSVIVEGLGRTDAGFGAIGGLTNYSTRASQYRKQVSLGYSISNRSYNHRVMASIGTGEIGKGWYLMAMASGRYAGKGYTEGTYYEAAGYFLAAEKKINEKHSLNFTFFGAPSQRGGSAPVVQEAYDLVGTNYYNPNWGYQTLPNGKQVIRNSRVSNYHQPMTQLTWYWTPTQETSLTTTAYFFAGKAGQTALEWGEAKDPRPDYYRNLPSYLREHGHSTAEIEALEAAWRAADPTVTQINWDALYAANMSHLGTVQNANGLQNHTISGWSSKYILAERHYDKLQYGAATIFSHEFSPNLHLAGGLNFGISRTHYYEMVNDLLGGDFYYDINKYAENMETDECQVDLNNPNHVAYVEDIINYNYYANRNNVSVWSQLNYLAGNFDFYVGANASYTQIWRTGLFKNGAFPEDSYGDSKKNNFFDPGVKGGVTYAINGRNHIVFNGTYMTKAPQFRDIYTSPRTRNTLVSDNLKSEKILSGDLSYTFRTPEFKLRATGYYTKYKNLVWNRSFYCENVYIGSSESGGSTYKSEFVNFVMTGVEQQSVGFELGAEYKVTPTITLQSAFGNGVHTYTSRPTFSVYDDNNAEAYIENETVYLKNYHVANGPETVASLGVKYSDPKNWWVSLNGNYMANMYFDVNPYNHTEFGLSHYAEGDGRLDDIINQKPLKPAFTLDFFAGYSRRYRGYYGVLTVSVNNILNNKNIVLYGYDQLRFNANDPDLFPSKYSYMYGMNFFINLTIRK